MTREIKSKANATSFKLGHPKIGGFVKGSRHTATSKKLISESLKEQFGSTSRRWKGESAGYIARHIWLAKHYGKAYKCENKACSYPNPKRFEWANLSGKYRREREDYIMLCPSCHRKMDLKKVEVVL